MQSEQYNGVYRKNSRGRAYFYHKDEQGALKIYRISCRLRLKNGQTVSIKASRQGQWLIVSEYQEVHFKRREPRFRRVA